MQLDCCCKTIAPHCPACHSVGGHGMDFALLVVGARGQLVTVETDIGEAIDAARVARGYVTVSPILVDYRDDDRVDAPAVGLAAVPDPLPRRTPPSVLDADGNSIWATWDTQPAAPARPAMPVQNFVCARCLGPWSEGGCPGGCVGTVGVPGSVTTQPTRSPAHDALSGPHDGFRAGGRAAYSPTGWSAERDVAGITTTADWAAMLPGD